jgi:hypothetical protein
MISFRVLFMHNFAVLEEINNLSFFPLGYPSFSFSPSHSP